MTTEAVLFALLRAAVCGEVLSEDVVAACTPEMLYSVYNLSARHDLAHLIGHTLEKINFPECEMLGRFKTAKTQAIYRYMRQDYEYTRICQALEESEIPYIPLKGTVLRRLYPEPWMRTSSDIDILVQTGDTERVVQLLNRTLSYRSNGKSTHDISMVSPSGVHLELHYDLIEASISKKSEVIFCNVWDGIILQNSEQYRYYLQDELFYFYHMTHMAKHVLNGGCGIRPFLDIWIMNHRMVFEKSKRERFLINGSMMAFAKAAERLSDNWFSNTEIDVETGHFGIYILSGGVYGSTQNQVAVQKVRKDHRKIYPLSRFILSYNEIKYRYPILERKPWLTPLYQFVRWYHLLGSIMHTLEKKKHLSKISMQEEVALVELMQYLEI